MELDKKRIAGELGIGEDILNELFGDFIAQTEKSIGELDTAVAADDFEGIRKAAHSIKGSSGNLRIAWIQETARSLEAHAKESRDKQAISENLQALKAGLEGLKKIV